MCRDACGRRLVGVVEWVGMDVLRFGCCATGGLQRMYSKYKFEASDTFCRLLCCAYHCAAFTEMYIACHGISLHCVVALSAAAIRLLWHLIRHLQSWGYSSVLHCTCEFASTDLEARYDKYLVKR